MTAGAASSAVYGTPGQLAALLDSIGRLLAREPAASWADPGVRAAAEPLAELVQARLAQGGLPADQTGA